MIYFLVYQEKEGVLGIEKDSVGMGGKLTETTLTWWKSQVQTLYRPLRKLFANK